jgi:UDPglucose 6-dehydrogenase
MSSSFRIGFAGLSHLGIIYSTATASKGFETVAFDGRPGWAGSLDRGQLPILEPGLEELLAAHRARLIFTDQVDAVAACNLIFFALDVATDEANQSDLGPLRELIQSVGSRVAPGTTFVVMSQVPPGFCRRLAAELPAETHLFYQVETLIFGNAVERAVSPERYMIGCCDPEEAFPEPYRRFLEAFQCPLLPMRYESAELCKIAINCFLVSTVSTTNMLSEICENVNADWSEIAPALRLDRRIGPYAYLKPGLGIAGGNLERDLVTVQQLSALHGCDTRIVTGWRQNSAYSSDWVLRALSREGLLKTPQHTVLALWGLAYKQDTHSTKNSPSLALLRSLPQYRWQAFDPVAKIPPADFPNVQLCQSELGAAKNADALIIMTPWGQFAKANLAAVLSTMRGREIYDPYATLAGEACRKLGFRYHRLGVAAC